MSRPFAYVTLALTIMMAFVIGLLVAGSTAPAPAPLQPPAVVSPVVSASVPPARQAVGLVNFADVAERLNPAVVNVEATTRGN